MTYKTCKIFTRLLTAPHLFVARRMEPFAKHLLNLVSWLERFYPIAAHCLTLADCGLGLGWNLSFHMKTQCCFAMVLHHFQQPLPVTLSNSTALGADALQRWCIVFHTANNNILREDTHEASLFVWADLVARSPAPLFVSSQGANLDDSLSTTCKFSLNKWGLAFFQDIPHVCQAVWPKHNRVFWQTITFYSFKFRLPCCELKPGENLDRGTIFHFSGSSHISFRSTL